MKLTAAPAGAGGQRLTAATDAITVPARRRAARASTGLWAGMVLAAFAGAALTVLARGNLKASDLTANLDNAAAAAAYATLGALIVRRAGNLIGWLMLGEGAGLAFITLASTYAVLGVATFPGALPAAKQVGTIGECSFVGIMFIIAFAWCRRCRSSGRSSLSPPIGPRISLLPMQVVRLGERANEAPGSGAVRRLHQRRARRHVLRLFLGRFRCRRSSSADSEFRQDVCPAPQAPGVHV